MIPERARSVLNRTGALLVAAVVMVLGGVLPASAAPDKLLDDLQAAYNGETNAQARYVAFAKKADQEGLAGVASLFRVAARGEETHAKAHAEVISKLGGVPAATVKLPPVKTTAENLKSAIDAESFERDKMYPEYIADAMAARNKDAIKDLKAVVAVEAEHAKLFTQAASNLSAWKTGRKFFMCQTCGLPVLVIDFTKCPICFTETSDFVEVS
jgi:rubrerythrin